MRKRWIRREKGKDRDRQKKKPERGAEERRET